MSAPVVGGAGAGVAAVAAGTAGADNEADKGAAGVRSGAAGFAATCAAGASLPAATAGRYGLLCSATSVRGRCLRRKETCCLVSVFVSGLASLLEADFVSDPVSNLAAFLAVTLLRGVAADLLE
jgi:hypothetical protein